MKNLFLPIIILMSAIGISAQSESLAIDSSQFKVISKVENGDVYLRWAPTSVETWHYIKEKGVVIEVLETQKELDPNYDFEVISPKEYEPWDSLDFENNKDIVLNSPELLVIAQCLIGKHEEFKEANIQDLIKKASYFEDCFHATLMSADLDFKAAIASGLGYKRTMTSDKDLVFKIYINFESKGFSSDTLFQYVSQNQPEIEIRPVLDSLISEENAVILHWSQAFTIQKFTAYNIQRSRDGISFYNINNRPLISGDLNDYFYIDSLVNDHKPYFYRIIGIDAFGSLSDPSEVMIGSTADLSPPNLPKITVLEQTVDGEILIQWEQNETPDLLGYEILFRRDSSRQQKITSQLLNRKLRSYKHQNIELGNKNYFQLIAIDTAGNVSRSFEKYLFRIDSIAPEKPLFIIGESSITNDGTLNLKWKANKEKDLLQYKVYFSNDPDHEFIPIKLLGKDETSYEDQLPLDNLTQKIYYKLQAIDNNYNSSIFSDPIELHKPDTIPPSAPAFWNYDIASDYIEIHWVPSYSKDVKHHDLYRKIGNQPFEKIASFDSKSSRLFKDKDIEDGGKEFKYMIIAVDQSGNTSECKDLLTLKTQFRNSMPLKPIIINDELNKPFIRIENMDQFPSHQFKFLKSVNGGPFITFATTNSGLLEDRKISKGNQYAYRVQAISPEGHNSEFSDVLEFNFE